ncbi:MAG: hypothetical protein V7730_22205, partial [Sulfitobacter sp.]
MARLTEDKPFLHPDCEITDASFGRYVEIGCGSRLAHSHMDDYSYCDRFAGRSQLIDATHALKRSAGV